MPSLYVHVPFCVRKCHYCAFYSHSLADCGGDLVSAFIEGLELEVAKRQKDAPQGVSSLFIGGGTPTVLKDEELAYLLKLLNRSFSPNPEAEKTMEGNPGTLTGEKIELLRRGGINRFSLGVQSFDDQLLNGAGRVHNAGQAREAVRSLRRAGFQNLNLDLMFGLPGQNMKSWQDTIEEALSFSPEHLSLYGLMLEEGTAFYDRYMDDGSAGECFTGRSPALPDDDLQAEMHDWAVRRLEQEGYRQYETSNFARPGFECQHNLGYWRGADYLGLGPGSVSCLNRVRWKNIEDVHAYRKSLQKGRIPLAEEGEEVLSLQECMAERMILGLRLAEGVSLRTFCEDFGVDLRDVYGDVLERYKYKDVFLVEDECLRLNPKYAFVANSVLQEFVGGLV